VDTAHVHVVALAWQFIVLLVVVVAGIGTLVAAMRGDPRKQRFSGRDWLLVGLLVFWAGDAALGSGRPVLERVAKGTAVVLFGSALGVGFCRDRRQRRQTDEVAAARSYSGPGA
jgi:hypothetical protein